MEKKGLFLTGFVIRGSRGCSHCTEPASRALASWRCQPCLTASAEAAPRPTEGRQPSPASPHPPHPPLWAVGPGDPEPTTSGQRPPGASLWPVSGRGHPCNLSSPPNARLKTSAAALGVCETACHRRPGVRRLTRARSQHVGCGPGKPRFWQETL